LKKQKNVNAKLGVDKSLGQQLKETQKKIDIKNKKEKRNMDVVHNAQGSEAFSPPESSMSSAASSLGDPVLSLPSAMTSSSSDDVNPMSMKYPKRRSY